jgi:hypothetical protein
LDQLTRVKEPPKVTPQPPPPVEQPRPVTGDDKAQILAVLNAYERAYEEENLGSLRRLWPTMNQDQTKGFEDFFKNASSVKLTYIVMGNPKIAGNNATLEFKQEISYVMNGNFPKPTPVKVTMKLSKTNATGTWQIDSIR